MAPRARLAVRAWPIALAALVLAPSLAPGFVLVYDMVFVPDMAMRRGFTGLGSGLPRAVPSDAVVAVLDEIVPGMVLQKVALVAALLLAGYGAQRLVPVDSVVARLGATTLYVWNPYVAERLGMGHWPILLAYGALPWIVDAARRFRDGERTLPALTWWLALAALSISGGVMGALVALVAVLGRGRAALVKAGAVLLCALTVNLPWLVSGFLHQGAARTDPAGVVAFASDAEGLLPLPLTLLGLGGVWNSEVVPASRQGWTAAVSLVVVVAVCVVGWRGWSREGRAVDRTGLLVMAAFGLVVAAAGALAPGFVGDLVAEVPGAGVIRDGSRFLGPLALLEAVLFGFGAARLLSTTRDRLVGASLAVGAVLAPIVLLPDLAWGLAGRLAPVDYPMEYAAARTALEDAAEGRHGSVLLLPFTPYRVPEWNDDRRTIDPLGRYLPVDYVASDELRVSGRPVAGEDPLARRVAGLLDDAARGALTPQALSAALRAEGIRWVVVDVQAQRAVGGVVPVRASTISVQSGRLTLLELDGPVALVRSSSVDRAAMALGWMAPAMLLGAAGVTLVMRLLRRRAVRSGVDPTGW